MTINIIDGDFSLYLRPQHQISVGFILPDENIIDLNAVVISIDETLLHLETFGSNTRILDKVPLGSSVTILSTENWAFCRCNGTLESIAGRNFTVNLNSKLEIEQRREHFRMDVNIPVCYSLPDNQQLSSVEGIWKVRRILSEFAEQPKIVALQGSFSVLEWQDQGDIDPLRVNLSAGGIRVKTPASFTPGALLNLNLFLPMNTIRIIDAVVAIIRSTEIRLTLDNRPAYTTAMKFIFLAERDRESIISYIFNEQRNSLRTQF